MTLDQKTLLQFLPQQMQDAGAGKHSDEYVLFLDLWGTSAALRKYSQTNDILDRANIAHVQSHFVSTLGRLSNESMFASVRTVQASDCSFSFSEDFQKLITFASSAFKCMTFRGNDFFFSPIRGGISKGVILIQDGGTLSKIPNFQYTSETGIGMVESASLEKNSPKGMRLFISESLKSEIPSFYQQCIKNQNDKNGNTVIELNWMHPDQYNTSYLNELITGLPQSGHTVKAYLESYAQLWTTNGDRYQQDIGCSLSDLLSW